MCWTRRTGLEHHADAVVRDLDDAIGVDRKAVVARARDVGAEHREPGRFERRGIRRPQVKHGLADRAQRRRELGHEQRQPRTRADDDQLRAQLRLEIVEIVDAASLDRDATRAGLERELLDHRRRVRPAADGVDVPHRRTRPADTPGTAARTPPHRAARPDGRDA